MFKTETAAKSFEKCGAVQIPGNGSNKSVLHV